VVQHPGAAGLEVVGSCHCRVCLAVGRLVGRGTAPLSHRIVLTVAPPGILYWTEEEDHLPDCQSCSSVYWSRVARGWDERGGDVAGSLEQQGQTARCGR
jgi:hypothetical protein